MSEPFQPEMLRQPGGGPSNYMSGERFPAAAPPVHHIEVDVRRTAGARGFRVVDYANTETAVHAHDWPVLSLYIMGAYTKLADDARTRISSPAAVLHPAGAFHANQVENRSLEQLDIEFDPAWLGFCATAIAGPVRCWIGGRVALAARELAAHWRRAETDDASLRDKTAAMLGAALCMTQERVPFWADRVGRILRDDPSTSTFEIARRVGVGPAWLARAYRRATGEGLAETTRRLRVERAVSLLRTTDDPAAEIAIEAGFCDQSHMIRAFHATVGRTPARVRSERPA